jgi:hypothetical protein
VHEPLSEALALGTELTFRSGKWSDRLATVVSWHTSNAIEANYQRTISDNWGTQLGAQVTNQWSVGEELLDDFNSYSWGLRSRASYRGTMLTLGFTRTGEAAVRRPFGGSPGFTSSMVFQFDRANEDAYRIGLSHNFVRLGFPGIGLIANYTRGRDAETDDGLSLHDTEEIAITADLRPEKGFFNGLWLRFRYADADRGSPDADRRHFRIIINYSLAAL